MKVPSFLCFPLQSMIRTHNNRAKVILIILRGLNLWPGPEFELQVIDPVNLNIGILMAGYWPLYAGNVFFFGRGNKVAM